MSAKFQQFNANLKTDTDKSFDQFVLSNNEITELEENVFRGLKFKAITIESKITRVDPNAFTSTSAYTTGIKFSGCVRIAEIKLTFI